MNNIGIRMMIINKLSHVEICVTASGTWKTCNSLSILDPYAFCLCFCQIAHPEPLLESSAEAVSRVTTWRRCWRLTQNRVARQNTGHPIELEFKVKNDKFCSEACPMKCLSVLYFYLLNLATNTESPALNSCLNCLTGCVMWP